MPKTPDEKKQQRPLEPDKGPAPPGNGRSKLRILIPAVVVLGLLAAAYASGIFKKLPTGFSVAAREHGAALDGPLRKVYKEPPSEKLTPQEKPAAQVNAAPVEGAKIAADAGDASILSVVERKPKTCPPSLALPSQEETSQAFSSEDSESPPKVSPSVPKATADLRSAPKAVETPVIPTKEPEKTETQSPKKKPEAGGRSAVQGDGDAQSPLVVEKAKDAEKGQKKPESGSVKEAAVDKAPEAEDKSQFQLPGSLKVRIHDYSGSLPKWALMVILDDSATMTRKTKNWTSGKIQTAEAVVEKIATSLSPGSKLAVRDFMCTKSEDKKAARKPCLSRMLYEWAEAPYSGLKEKIEHTDTGGATNPCAAAAYSLKKDFGGSEGVTPRVILITDGASKCAFGEAAKALDQHKAKGRVGVDVVAVGMGKKRQAGYEKLVKKTQGKLIKIDKPLDLDSGISHYAKLLRTPVMEKVEVKGDNSVFTTSLEEEITLAPGSYTVVLPVVAGLNPSKRTVPNVKINSAEASILDVRIKKGKPTIKVVKK